MCELQLQAILVAASPQVVPPWGEQAMASAASAAPAMAVLWWRLAHWWVSLVVCRTRSDWRCQKLQLPDEVWQWEIVEAALLFVGAWHWLALAVVAAMIAVVVAAVVAAVVVAAVATAVLAAVLTVRQLASCCVPYCSYHSASQARRHCQWRRQQRHLYRQHPQQTRAPVVHGALPILLQSVLVAAALP